MAVSCGAGGYPQFYATEARGLFKTQLGALLVSVRKVFAERQVLWQCLSGNEGTSTRFCIISSANVRQSLVLVPWFPPRHCHNTSLSEDTVKGSRSVPEQPTNLWRCNTLALDVIIQPEHQNLASESLTCTSSLT